MSKVSISGEQVRRSLEGLKKLHPYFGMAFLAFKTREIPVGRQVQINFAKLMKEFLTDYYKPSQNYSGFYNPFRTSDPSNRWVTEKYPSGALQRIVVDTFGAAIIHNKNDPHWGWCEDYIKTLQNLQSQTRSSLIPIIHLAIWLFRRDEYSEDLEPSALVTRFTETFHIIQEEYCLFDFDFSMSH